MNRWGAAEGQRPLRRALFRLDAAGGGESEMGGRDMLTAKEQRMCRMLLSGYRKALGKYVARSTALSAPDTVWEYEERFCRYMNGADMGEGRGRFTSYLNIFSGLAAYEILRDDGQGFTYEIRRCLYFDTCREHGYPEFCRVFCAHDWYALGVLKRHARFIRQSTIAENGTVCHDTIERVK